MNDKPTDPRHTPTTNEILNIIVIGHSNRYQVALRLTEWHQRALEMAELRARIDEIDRLGNYKGQFEGRWDLNDAVEERTAQLEAALKEMEQVKS